MKKKYVFVLTAALGIFMVQDAYTNSGGAPSGNGSPSNGASCDRAGCHNGPAVAGQTVSISTNIPANGFKEDSIYQITISANNNGSGTDRMGFAATVESASGHEGTIIVSDASNTQKIGTRITHTFAGISGSGGQNSWTFDWNAGQAPDQTTVYTAVNFANQNGSTSGDVIISQSFALNKNLGIGMEEVALNKIAAYPNPAIDLLTVSSSTKLSGPFKVLSTDGKSMPIEALEQAANHWELEVGHLPSGLYILSDNAGNQIRFTKQ